MDQFSKQESQSDQKQENLPKVKEVKLEEKPFQNFLNEDFIPKLTKELKSKGCDVQNIELSKGPRPVVGGTCWSLLGQIDYGRRFWLCFEEESIKSGKTISLAESGSQPSLLESFLIDEKKITLALLLSRLLQRLNGQKWLRNN